MINISNIGPFVLFVCFYLRKHEATVVSEPILILAWVTSVLTSAALYIEFSTQY